MPDPKPMTRQNAPRVAVRPDQIITATGQNPGKVRVRYNQADDSYTILGVTPDTFWSPLQPLRPMADDPKYGTVGRQFDYLVGQNLQYIPRGQELVSFAQLRALADNLDILRLIIETRKDQMAALEWSFTSKDKKKEVDTTDLKNFFAYPDKIHDFADWQRMLLEDAFVTDAMCIYPALTNGGDLYSLDPMDGTTITPQIDETGRSPLPPSPAYQQINKGVPTVDYTRDELIYRPRNPRTWKLYGYGPVEQIIFTVCTAMSRNLFVADYYKEGSIPDAFAEVPDNWTPAQVNEFQQNWDILFGNITGQNHAMRRGMKFIPGMKSINFAKKEILKDEFDEWLARICCYAFSVEPTPFVKQMNRGTGETQKEQSRMEGLIPWRKWWKSLMDFILVKYLKRTDVEFSWMDEEASDPLESAQVSQIYVNAGVKTRNEVREEIGLEPLDGLDEPETPTTEQTASQAAAAQGSGDGGGNAPSGQPAKPASAPAQPSAAQAEKIAVAANAMSLTLASKAAPVEPLTKAKTIKTGATRVERQATMIQRQRMTRAIKRQFRAQADNIAGQLAAVLKLGKASGGSDDKTLDQIIHDLDWDSCWEDFPAALRDPLSRTSADSVENSVTLIPQTARVGVSISKDFINTYASDYADTRSAEMVGKKLVDGELVDNPDARWVITDETRNGVRSLVKQAIDGGWSNDRLKQQLRDAYAFSGDRAEKIARTETAFADSQGNLAGWKESGVVTGKQWLTANDDLVSPECAENGEAGIIGLDDDFPSGDGTPPVHPACRCSVSPVVNQE